MSNEKTSPQQLILINGVEMPADMQADVLRTVVCQHVEGGNSFQVCLNAMNSTNQQLKWIDDDVLQPGNEVDIQFGYLGELNTVIVGEVTALQVHFPSDDTVTVEIQGFDRLHRFRRGRNTRVFNGVKDSQIAETIASDLGLDAEVEDTEIVHKYVVQNNLSDMDLLLDRARRIRYEVLVRNRTLKFRPAANFLGETTQMEYPLDLKAFSVRMSTAQQVSEVVVRSWNPASKEALLGVGTLRDVSTRMGGNEVGAEIAENAFMQTTARIVDIPVYSQAEAEQIAKAKFNDMAVSLMCGEAEAVGNTELRAGEAIQLNGLGQRFTGLYYITKAEHCMEPSSGYITKLQVQRSGS